MYTFSISMRCPPLACPPKGPSADLSIGPSAGPFTGPLIGPPVGPLTGPFTGPLTGPPPFWSRPAVRRRGSSRSPCTGTGCPRAPP
ncbi:hypothetical protein ETD85_30100 [Nonomuraea zeae]|uniref:Uncharacterized protein n=1 Tax=Nonomuraea zeae TaxID=1642303 RepID=A0A5S4GCF2_9ACTN|nr:hypothetical protein ETD85_30100 [Nonomuraea zeae]